MTYKQALRVKVGSVLKPRVYNWDYRFGNYLFHKRDGVVSEIKHDELYKKIIFTLEDGRKFEHTEIREAVMIGGDHDA